MAVDRLRNNPIIIFDTNALFIPFEFKININFELDRIVGSYQIIIPTCVLSELKRLSKTERYGKLALELALKNPQPAWYPPVEEKLLKKPNRHIAPLKYDDNPVDNQILEIADELNGIVVTNDRTFLKILKKNNIRTISMRKKRFLIPNYKI